MGKHTFNNETYYATIIGFNHNADIETGGNPSVTFQFGETEDGTRIAFTDSDYRNDIDDGADGNGYCINSENTNEGGWESSYMRNTICAQFFDALPEDIQNIIGDTIKYTDNVGGSRSYESNVTATKDKIFLLNYEELNPTSSDLANPYEANYTVPYSDCYTDYNSRKRYQSGVLNSTVKWWSRSVSVDDYDEMFFNIVDDDYDYYDHGDITNKIDPDLKASISASCSLGFAPAFTIF